MRKHNVQVHKDATEAHSSCTSVPTSDSHEDGVLAFFEVDVFIMAPSQICQCGINSEQDIFGSTPSLNSN